MTERRADAPGMTTQWSRIEQLRGSEATEAWHWFIDRYRGFVTAALRRMIWAPDRAAAAGDEFWGYLFQSGTVQRLQRPMRFRAFLVGTLRNYARDWMRRNPRHVEAEVDGELAGQQGTLPEDVETALWARQVLQLAMQRMDREQPRGALALRAFYGLPAGIEVEPASPQGATALGQALGCSPNALHQLLFRARGKLREFVAEEVRQTVHSEAELAAELATLLAAMGTVSPGIVDVRRDVDAGKKESEGA